MVSITFDDDLADAFHIARPLMAVHGWGGTGYVLASTVGSGLTLEQLHHMEDDFGWEIAGHGYARHDDLTRLASEEADAELRETSKWLTQHAFRGRHHFAYPYSGQNRRVRALASRHFRAARVVMGGAATTLPPEPARLLRLGAFTWGSGYANVASLVRELDRTRADAGWAILVFHAIDGDGPYAIRSDEFSAILGHVAALGLAVAPVGAVLGLWDDVT